MEDIYSTYYDSAFDQIPGLTWRPWVGSDYWQKEHRLLIVGESHYIGDKVEDKRLDVKKCMENPETTRSVILRKPLSNVKVRTFDNLHRCLLHGTNVDKVTFWKSIAFYNFVQRPMPGIKHRPGKSDYEQGWRAFVGVVEVLRPTQCLFVGVAAAEHFNDMVNQLELKSYEKVKRVRVEGCRVKARRFSLTLSDGYTIPCIAIQHTSHHFSWRAWNHYLGDKIGLF